MTGFSEVALVFQSAVCLAVLSVVLLIFWSALRLDAFRQELFEIRDELFDYAAAGNIKFDDPAYRLLRKFMNGFIRYGHQLTFFRLCVTMAQVKLADRTSESQWTEEWQHALKRVASEEVRIALVQFHDRTMYCATERLIFGSPILISLVLCSVPILIVRMGWQNLKQILIKAPSFTLSHVFDTRIIENQAAAA
jgi:hypothetical protein